MHPIDDDIAWLEEEGWQADKAPRSVRKRYRFDSFQDTVQFMMELAESSDLLSDLPSIRIDGGTDVRLRVGPPPCPALTADQIEIAKALAAL